MPAKYTLRYFDVRARGEVTRLLLTLKGEEFEDKRFSQETWAAEKPSKFKNYFNTRLARYVWVHLTEYLVSSLFDSDL